MSEIKNHPDWWCVLTLDGFTSHITVASALEVFREQNIFVVKEEADTSHVNQAYDQSVAKVDKLNVRWMLDLIRSHLSCLTQWYLIVACVIAFKKTGVSGAWISSFKRVNLHPHFRVPFDDWAKRIKQHIDTSDNAFFSERTPRLMQCQIFGKI